MTDGIASIPIGAHKQGEESLCILCGSVVCFRIVDALGRRSGAVKRPRHIVQGFPAELSIHLRHLRHLWMKRRGVATTASALPYRNPSASNTARVWSG